ncbi:MAG TPA: pyridoxal phosphate-dependent aminotransferase [Syntrophales bacterium]|nr:pyridoxal phosphate-dependent aminotransferase [Syntrophales bacterium]HOM06184.1 pyridoxal phosphate-dependent aminotransferase [Syntrophales bacterium]HOO00738.1 pyridoxal phosphate-dependent aminotransferase [Syntrophales bacterium]HPC01038.1 pyridoxal phosphate-dependent aminotransferase [Syntrophales bacterium]HPQ05667.1 pyridoxal phosphate-dependent aminotransferase [Syntrophales bacterium]
MTLALGKRHEWVMQSEIRAMSIACDRRGGINLSQGVCDMEVPVEVRRAAQEAMEAGLNTYTRYDGIAELRRAIAAKEERFAGLAADPETEIVVSAGATGALFCTCLALLDPGDEVIVFEPFYGYHISTLVAAEAVPVYVRLEPPDWTFTARDLEAVVTARTKALIINTPANPSGKVFSDAELSLLADFAVSHDLFVFTDEIYEHFLYDGRRHVAPATLRGMRERTVTISGLSKTFSITGWRVGYAICDAAWAQAIGYFNDLVYVCAPAPLQAGVARGLEVLGEEYYRGLVEAFTRKREMICRSLEKAGLRPFRPAGAYYVLADISGLPGGDDKEKVMYLLDRTSVAAVPGRAFFNGGGEDLARFCFAKEDPVLAEACRRLEAL